MENQGIIVMRHFYYGVFTFFILIITSCTNNSSEKTNKTSSDSLAISNQVLESQVNIDLPEIKEKGTLTAITSYSSTSFFIYRGQLMGFEYELLRWLADYLELELEIEIAQNLDMLVTMLNQGKGDIIAHNLTITKERKEYLKFTNYHTLTKQVLVQRKPNNWHLMKIHRIENKLVRNPIHLIGKQVHVRKNTAYYERLTNLSEEIGGDIRIIPAPSHLVTEEIIKMVARGEINYTVADQNIALLNQTYYPNVDVNTEVSFPQRIAWAVRKNSPELQAAVNAWVEEIRGSEKYNVIYNKYFKNNKAFKKRVKSEFFSRTGNKISPYDELIKRYAGEIGWDWRLLASLIYQESNFKPSTRSWAGAVGLMQVLPSTAKSFGVTNLSNPEQNLKAGTAYLRYLTDYWEQIPDSITRRKFILASYNAGPGHVLDARNLADKYKRNPDRWDGHVEYYLLMKSHPEYYNDDVVRYGYCRGEEPYAYVREITERYNYYAEFIN
jgi:membrane-bound lytic murein transglycosylase F